MKKLSIDYIEDGPAHSCNKCKKSCTVYYCQRGRISGSIGEKNFALWHGDILIATPDTAYTFSVCTPYTVFFEVSFDLSDELNFFGSNTDLHKISLPPEEIVFFESNMYKIFSEYSKKKDYYTVVCELSFKTLWIIIKRLYNQLNIKPVLSNTESFIHYCISYTDAHCSENISLSDIVKLSNVSRALFCPLFKKETGLSFKSYLNRKRIQKAIALMKTRENITDIVYMCGYTEQSTFYRNFVKFTGLSPAKFREKLPDYEKNN